MSELTQPRVDINCSLVYHVNDDKRQAGTKGMSRRGMNRNLTTPLGGADGAMEGAGGDLWAPSGPPLSIFSKRRTGRKGGSGSGEPSYKDLRGSSVRKALFCVAELVAAYQANCWGRTQIRRRCASGDHPPAGNQALYPRSSPLQHQAPRGMRFHVHRVTRSLSLSRSGSRCGMHALLDHNDELAAVYKTVEHCKS